MNPAKIKALLPGRTVFDDVVTGLHVRRQKTNTSWYLYYRTRGGTERKPKIGEWPTVSIADARRRARSLLDRVVVGEDPGGDWENQKKEMTLDVLAEEVWTNCWSKLRSKWGVEAKRNYEKNVAPEFGGKRLSDIKPLDLKKWMKGFEDRPYAGNRSLQVISKLFSYAEENELVPLGTNPTRIVSSFPEKKRTRYATEDEIKKLCEILDRELPLHPEEVTFLYALMYSGCRPSVLENAKRSDLDPATGILTLEGKSSDCDGLKDIHVFPKQVLEMILALPVHDGGKLFGVTLPKKFWNRVREEAGCPDLWARDSRRTLASLGVSTGIPMDVIGGLLNHRTNETTMRYAKVFDQTKVEATNKIAHEIDQIRSRKVGL